MQVSAIDDHVYDLPVWLPHRDAALTDRSSWLVLSLDFLWFDHTQLMSYDLEKNMHHVQIYVVFKETSGMSWKFKSNYTNYYALSKIKKEKFGGIYYAFTIRSIVYWK